MTDYASIILTITAGAVVFLAVVVFVLMRTVMRLIRDSHPPMDLAPAMVDTLKRLGVICARPPEDWYCTRPAGHRGPCAAHAV